jgi:hypothetical protein
MERKHTRGGGSGCNEQHLSQGLIAKVFAIEIAIKNVIPFKPL